MGQTVNKNPKVPPDEDPSDRILWGTCLDWLIPPKMFPPRPTYKDIKLLGTRLDTKTDIQARKARVWDPIKKFRNYFRSKRLSIGHKVRVYRTYVESQFCSTTHGNMDLNSN